MNSVQCSAAKEPDHSFRTWWEVELKVKAFVLLPEKGQKSINASSCWKYLNVSAYFTLSAWWKTHQHLPYFFVDFCRFEQDRLELQVFWWTFPAFCVAVKTQRCVTALSYRIGHCVFLKVMIMPLMCWADLWSVWRGVYYSPSWYLWAEGKRLW